MKFVGFEKLTEAREVATKTKTANTDTLFSKDFFSPSKTDEKPLAVQQDQKRKLSRAVASADTSNVPAISGSELAALGADDDDTDVSDARPEPSEPSNLPATISHDVRAKGMQNPDWMSISQLPGYMQTGIKMMGKTVFSTLTDTKLRDINLLVNLQNNGPNDTMELNAVAKHARDTAESSRDLEMRFGELIPGYKPEAKMFVNKQDTYLVIRDDMGEYIYHWPTSDTKHNEYTKTKRLK